MKSRLLDTKQLQEELGVGRNVAYGLMKSESFPSIQIGRKYYIDRIALDEWLKENRYSSIIIEE